MKHTLPAIAAFLLASHFAAGQEAWYLEMEPRYAEALVEKYRAANHEAYLQVLAKLPDLIKEGRMVEIERITMTDEAKGGLHFPRRKIKTNGQEDQERDIGSSYGNTGMGKNRLRMFEIVTYKRSVHALMIASAGKLSKEWMPTFISSNATSTRLLLERNPEAAEAFSELKGRLQASTGVPEKFTATWLLTGELLEQAKTPALKPDTVFYYSDCDEYFHVEQREIRQLGTVVTWKLTETKGFAFEMSDTKLVSGKRYSHDIHESRGEVAGPGELLKTDVQFYRDQLEGEKLEKKNPEVKGQVDYGFLPIK